MEPTSRHTLRSITTQPIGTLTLTSGFGPVDLTLRATTSDIVELPAPSSAAVARATELVQADPAGQARVVVRSGPEDAQAAYFALRADASRHKNSAEVRGPLYLDAPMLQGRTATVLDADPAVVAVVGADLIATATPREPSPSPRDRERESDPNRLFLPH